MRQKKNYYLLESVLKRLNISYFSNLFKLLHVSSFMKKQAKELKKDDKIIIADQKCIVSEIEISDIGKHGKRKVRIEAQTEKGEKIIIIRPEDYPFSTPD